MRDDVERKARPAGVSIGSLVASAVQLLAPNSLQFNEHEFQRSPKEAQLAAREAAKLIKPGDLIFITTSGLLYSLGRQATNSDYDHVAAVLDDSTVLHVGMPTAKLMPLERLLLPQRQPVVVRVSMTDTELQQFLRCARQLVGSQYDIVRACQLVLRLALKHVTGKNVLRKLPVSVKTNSWICSDSILVLLAGCSEKFREALAKARVEANLDIFIIGSASLSDFARIRQIAPEALRRIPLPVVDYTLKPRRKTWRQYGPELVHFLQKVQSGGINWSLLQANMFPEMQAIAARIPPEALPLKVKLQVISYAIVLLILVKRGLTVKKMLLRAVQIMMLRYFAQQVVQYLNDRQLIASRL